MQTSQFVAPDIECDGCANSIKRALQCISGIEHVEVDVPTKTVTVAHGPQVTREALKQALDRAGFPVSAG